MKNQEENEVQVFNRREDDRSIAMLTMAIERLAESQVSMSSAQTQMSIEIKDLAKTVSKLDVVMEKMLNIEDRHSIAQNSTNDRLKSLEKGQLEGCPALRELKVGDNGRYDKLVLGIDSNKEDIVSLQKFVYKISWSVAGLVASVIGTAVLMLVLK